MIKITKFKKDISDCDICKNQAEIEIDIDDKLTWLCSEHKKELAFDLVLNDLISRLQARQSEFAGQLDPNYTPKSVKAEIIVQEIDHLIAMCKGEV